MTVEAVPAVDELGAPYPEAHVKAMHTTMQTFGRVAIIGGFVLVAALNIIMFANVEQMSEGAKIAVYANIYLLALAIPAISVGGVVLAAFLRRRRARHLRQQGLDDAYIASLLFAGAETTKPNWWILGGSVVFAAFTLAMGLSDIKHAQELIFVGSMGIIVFLMHQLVARLEPAARRALVGTAIIIFVFRAIPLPGAGATWFEIDALHFDQRFLAVLSLIGSGLTLAGMFVLRPLMATRSLAYVVALLAIAGGLLSLPNIGLYFGIQQWTANWTGGVVDARFIALVDTTLESPLGQIAMIPMLAWIAKNAPAELKATFFAVMASFTNLALSASSLGTRYLNEIFVVTREVRDRTTGAVLVAADYSALGWLLIAVAAIGVIVPLLTILIIQRSPLRTRE
jgi:hypothetical protein